MPATIDRIFDLSGRRIWVAGHQGMVGSALMRALGPKSAHLLTADRKAVDLTRQADTEAWIQKNKPEVIFIAAAKVGGILANANYPADFLYRNLMIEANILEAAFRCNTKKVVFLGSSCIYPKFSPQPITEDALLTGPLEPTNEAYAIAKIAGIKLTQAYRQQHGCDFISAMPTNLYGPNDNFDPESSHVMPALIRKAHTAKCAGSDTMTIWGSGTPRREFLHVDDCAEALIFLAEHYSDHQHVNVGAGHDLTILELTESVCRAVGFTGSISTDPSYPDGTPRKLMSSEVLRRMGWAPRIDLVDGIRSTYEWFLKHHADGVH